MTGQGLWSQIFFWLFAVIAVTPTLGILLAKDIVRQAFWLLASLAGFAGLYLQMGADFLGFAQVVVYIGGILILFLFGVMLTHKFDVPLKEITGWNLIVPGIVSGVIAATALLYAILRTDWASEPERAVPTTSGIGELVMSEYILPFEVVSIVLLVALVGATYVARRGEKEEMEE